MPPPRRPGPKGSSVKRPSIKAKEDMEKEKDGNDSSGIVTKEEHFTVSAKGDEAVDHHWVFGPVWSFGAKTR